MTRLSALLMLVVSAYGQTLLQQSYDSRSYIWSRTNGLGAAGDLSAPGSGKTITLTRPPKGVYGSNSSHYLYISGGTGTAESALITGGSCSISSTGSCTITVTTANAHSGAWSVGSATSGVQEALWAGPGVGFYEVRLPAGGVSLYAGVVVPNRPSITIKGADKYGTSLNLESPNLTAISVNQGQFNITIENLVIIDFASGSTTSVGVLCDAISPGLTISQIRTSFLNVGFHVGDCSQIKLLDVSARDLEPGTGVGVYIDNSQVETYIRKLDCISDKSPATRPYACVHSIGVDTFTIVDSELIGAEYGMLLDPPNGRLVSSVLATNVWFDNNPINGLLAFPALGGTVERMRFVNCWFSSATETGVVLEGTSGTIRHISFTQSFIFFNEQHGFQATNIHDLVLTGNTITGNSIGNSGVYNGVVLYTGEFVASGNIVGTAEAPSDTHGTNFIVASGAYDHYSITGNVFWGGVAALSDDGTGINKVVRDNGPVPAVPIASASSISLLGYASELHKITGTTPIATITRGWTGRRVTFIFTDASPGGFTTGGNITRAQAAVQNQAITLTFDGTNWY